MPKVPRSLIALATIATLASPAVAGAASKPKATATYSLGSAKHCRTHFVKKTLHHKVHGKSVRYVACVYVAPTVSTPVLISSPVTPSSPTAPAPASTPPVVTLGVNLDPSFTQDAANPLKVTWDFSVSATQMVNGLSQVDAPLPSGIAEFFVDGSLSQSVNVGGSVTGGEITTTLASYGAHTTDLVYDAGANSATSGNEQSVIEPPAITVNDTWGTTPGTVVTGLTADVIGTTANVTLTDPNFEGATSIQLTDNLSNTCQANVNTTTATCSMSVTGTPTAFTVAYPGGVSTQSTQPVPPNGVQQVTTAWPASSVHLSGGQIVVSVQAADAEWSNWAIVPNGGSGTSNPPNPISASVGGHVNLFVTTTGNVQNDGALCNFGAPIGSREPCGFITFTVTQTSGTPSTVTLVNEELAGGDCSMSQNFSGQAEGGCQIFFSGPGTYQVTAEYISQDANYANVAVPRVLTINVTSH